MIKNISESKNDKDFDLSTEKAIEAENNALSTDRRAFLALAGMGAGAAALGLSGQSEANTIAPLQDEAFADSALTLDDIKSAERVMDLDYPENRRRDVLDNIEGTRRAVKQVRAFSLENGLAPAPAFDPRLPGKDYGAEGNKISLPARTAKLPTSKEDIAFASVNDLSHWIKTKQISSLELTNLYLDRISKYAGTLKCFVTVTDDLARAEARAADDALARGDYKGPLHGIPYALKDLADTKGIKTTWGAEPFKDRVPDSDATLVTKLRDAGAVLLGKATSGGLAIGDVWFGGITRNPWNTGEGSSGSSAGPASAVAAGLAAFGIGTETLGSIISPANRCGLAGLRPTFGRVSRHGFMALSWSLDKAGPLCRYIEDTATVMSVINGYDIGDASSIERGFDYDGGQSLADIRIGYLPAAFEGDNVNALDKKALEAIKGLGVVLKEITLPDLPYGGMAPIIRAESSAAFDELIRSNEVDQLKRRGPSARAVSLRTVRMLSAIDYINMERLRRVVMQAMDEVFSDVDVIVGPNYAQSMLSITNYTGSPQAIIRAGFEDRESAPLNGQPRVEGGPKYSLPRGFSVFGGLYKDAATIRVAKAIEQALGAADARPKMD
jgi:Asp-tRNA(Asn)/Glu-tRNA(Gln) amidotransferase A subunit family amidase